MSDPNTLPQKEKDSHQMRIFFVNDQRRHRHRKKQKNITGRRKKKKKEYKQDNLFFSSRTYLVIMPSVEKVTRETIKMHVNLVRSFPPYV
jgi:hypothetical protein